VFRNLLKSLAQKKPAGPDLETQLARLEEEARAPALDFRAAVYGRAGDLCVEAGETQRAIVYFGRAIDGYLGAGYYDSALNLCRKVVDLSPDVVRARCTMAFLLLAQDLPYLRTRGISKEARDQLKEYAFAAVAAGRGPIATQRLKMMADVTEVEEIRQLIGDLLFELGAADEAAELHYSLFEERANLAEIDPERSQTQRLRWAEMLRMAIMDE
jgi:tetratricopeptide (TPR) repeat protein